MPPEQWEQFVVALDCLTKKRKADERRGAKDENYDEWRNAAVLKLPDDVFVWLDEFQRWYSTTRPLKDTDDYLKWEHNQERLNAKRQEPGSVLTESEWNELDASPPEMQEDARLCLSPILPPEIENKLWRFGDLTPDKAIEQAGNMELADVYHDGYVSALLLLAPYWDKPACELPENLREIASPLWDMATPEGRQNLARQHDEQHDPTQHWLWWDVSMDARMWWGLQDIAPREAAMLLCRLNPHECEREDPERIYVDGDKSSLKRYRLMLRTFEDVAKAAPQARTLSQWLGIARDKQLQYHPWIDEYERGIGLEVLAEAPATPDAPENGDQAAVEQMLPAADANTATAKVNNLLTKGQITAAFEDLHYNADQWSKYLASPPPWLVECRKAKGSKTASALWNPVEIAVALTDLKRGISVQKLDAVFVAHTFLKSWAEEWRNASEYLR